MVLKQVQLLSAKLQQATVQRRKLPVQKPILNTNMPKQNIKKEKEKKRGTNCRNKWSKWASPTKRKNLSNKKYYIKNLKIIDFREQRFR